MSTSLAAALATISTKSSFWNLFLDLVEVLVMVSAHWAKGSTGSGVGIGAMVESGQATQASQVEAETVAEEVIVDNALPDVIDEAVTAEEIDAEAVPEEAIVENALPDIIDDAVVGAEELLATELLDGATEELVAELAEFVGGGCVTDGWFADGCLAVASGLSGPASSIA